jgi:beta-glucosidase
MGLEGRARGTHFQLGPGMNICRVPVNGRNFEYFGEDPYLAAAVATAWVRACSSQGVVPTIKHYACNNQEANRNTVDVQVDERTLHEIYLPAFKKSATEGGIVAVMCSYNRLNGSYASNSDWLQNQVLRRMWGFEGLVMSDWGASHATSDLTKGLDLEMPTPKSFDPNNIQPALADGTLKVSDLDHAVHRILRTAFAQGWLDAKWEQKKADLPLDSADSAKTALEVAQSAIVLLKNDRGVLPLDRAKVKTLFVVGPNAAAQEGQMPSNIGGGGSGSVQAPMSRLAEAEYLKAITARAGDDLRVVHAPMPSGVPEGTFDVFNHAYTAAGQGQPGLTLTTEVTGDGPAVQIAPSVQKAINATWQTGQLPFGVPAGRNAMFTWKGVLIPPKDGDWQLHTAGFSMVTIDGRTLDAPDSAILHLRKDRPTAIVVQARAMANPPSRGRRGGPGGFGGRGGNQIRVAITPPMLPDLAAAKTADVAIVCVGLNRGLESEGRDRSFDLPSYQQYLISAVCKANPRTIVINNSGAAVGMADWINQPAAVLQAWYLGQEGGLAIASVLFGDFNPCGHLCSTFDRTFEDNPAFASYPGTTPAGTTIPIVSYSEGLFYGYRGYDKTGKQPLFPFGYGLSYTSFAFSNLECVKSGNCVNVSLDVKNTGKRPGAEVVQVYVGEQGCPLPRPKRELKGFSKVMLKPGETRRVQISLPKDAFSYWSPDKKDWTVDAGHQFTIEAGMSERDIKAKGAVTY